MSILDINLSNVPDEPVLQPGEQTLNIVAVETRVSERSGKPYISVIMKSTTDKFAKSVFHVLSLPCETDTPEEVDAKRRRIRTFVKGMGLSTDVSSINTEEWLGREITVILATEVDEQYGERSVVKRIM